jgi:hypothetical protein
MKTQREWVSEAMKHESARRWSEASKAWDEATKTPAEHGPAKRGDRRATSSGIAPGTVLRHRQWGKVTAECTFVAEGDVRFDGVSYTSLSEAANAAAAAQGKKSKTLNGWVYWGVDRQEQDRTGWDQTKSETIDELDVQLADGVENDDQEDDEIDARVDAYLAELGL